MIFNVIIILNVASENNMSLGLATANLEFETKTQITETTSSDPRRNPGQPQNYGDNNNHLVNRNDGVLPVDFLEKSLRLSGSLLGSRLRVDEHEKVQDSVRSDLNISFVEDENDQDVFSCDGERDNGNNTNDDNDDNVDYYDYEFVNIKGNNEHTNTEYQNSDNDDDDDNKFVGDRGNYQHKNSTPEPQNGGHDDNNTDGDDGDNDCEDNNFHKYKNYEESPNS
eukprot:Awhi_evm1s7237